MHGQIYPTLPASDIDRARKWYSDLIGIEPEEAPNGGGYFYEWDGTGFMVYASDFAGTNKATAAGFIVEDFDGTVGELRAKGIEFMDLDFGEGMTTVDGVMSDPDSGMKSAWFTDSEGNILAVSNDIR